MHLQHWTSTEGEDQREAQATLPPLGLTLTNTLTQSLWNNLVKETVKK